MTSPNATSMFCKILKQKEAAVADMGKEVREVELGVPVCVASHIVSSISTLTAEQLIGRIECREAVASRFLSRLYSV